MSVLRNILRRRLISGLAVVVLAGVPVAVVMANAIDGPDVDEGGAAHPPRTGPSKVVASGITDDGQRYVVTTSWSAQKFPDGSRELCVAIEYHGQADAAHRKPAPPATSEICALPGDSPIVWTLDEVFVDPQTLKPLDQPRRFVYGLVTDQAAAVRVRGPNGNDRKLDTSKLPDAPGKVFAGSAPEGASGWAEVTAESETGADLASREIKFHGLARSPAPAGLGSPSH